ncbi:hypothetical protein NPIL_345591 [Nephila pilipes]|uniref:Uncharacterized protein n=1 Tax=Nephila pilipes TaxID=299642 RepID=A0A8X6NT26_NEPPI|nr:hypothetical protein NPIL_345591 [Nephila pilipes]
MNPFRPGSDRTAGKDIMSIHFINKRSGLKWSSIEEKIKNYGNELFSLSNGQPTTQLQYGISKVWTSYYSLRLQL